MARIALALFCAFAASLAVRAEVRLAGPFGDHMVLQCGVDVPVWGSTEAGERVTVEFAGQAKSATPGRDGRWSVTLAPLEASGDGRPLTVRGGTSAAVTVADVVVGEVWVCAGQSNMQAGMERLLRSAAGPQLKAEAAERYGRELATTTRGVRLFRAGSAKGDERRGRWMACGPEALRTVGGQQGFSAAGYFFAKELQGALKVPVGAIEAAVGGTTIETWTPAEGAVAAAAAATAPSSRGGKGAGGGRNFEGEVAPLIPFAVRGVVWYQGESNLIEGDAGPRYAGRMETMIERWRALWGRPELPFYYVQLPRHLYAKRRPDLLTDESLAYFREGQAQAQRVPHTGMIVTSDLVDAPADIHPPDKWDVGHRLALVALAQTYGRQDVEFSGPLFKAMEVRDGAAVLTFEHIGKGLVSRDGKPLAAFTVAGADRRFVAADAVIEGDAVVVSSAAVPRPAAVRFCWHELDVPNLFNRDGLPAAPFRTDDWPIAAPAPTTTRPDGPAAPATRPARNRR